MKESSMTTLKFALNHMTSPSHSVDGFLDLAQSLNIAAVELRNDLRSGLIADGLSSKLLSRKLADRGLELLSINALQRFNDWNGTREEQAKELIDYAGEAGAKALVLVPANDGSTISLERLTQSLNALGPLLRSAGLIGLVEPLGFEKCTLRYKAVALQAITASAFAAQFKLVHDTFHHFVAGETELFAQKTGLVHLSGVTDRNVDVGALLDDHRVLVDDNDSIDNVAQIKALIAGGYDGYFSFEPFSNAVHQSADIARDVKATIAYLEGAL
jgi:2-keto-myo-inositol isomerase